MPHAAPPSSRERRPGRNPGIRGRSIRRTRPQPFSFWTSQPGSNRAVLQLGQIPTWKMPAIYDTHDLFIWPSLREGFGLPPLEAMARGVPVVTTDNGGSREFAIHEETALVSPPGDITSMTQNLLRLVSEPDLRQKLAHNGRELARSRFTWELTCSAFEAVIEKNKH